MGNMKRPLVFVLLGVVAVLAADQVVRYTPGDSGFVDYQPDKMFGLDKLAAGAAVGGVFMIGTKLLKV